MEAKDLGDKQKELQEFIDSQDTINKLERVESLKAQLEVAASASKPIQEAYLSFKLFNTATAELINSNIMGPINAETMELNSINVKDDAVEINVDVADASVLSTYLAGLRAERTSVDKDFIDKPNNAEQEDGDQEIIKFNDLFASNIIEKQTRQPSNQTTQTSPEDEAVLGYTSVIRLFFNKDLSNTARRLAGGGN
jgi:hypothetical protein